MARNFTLSTLLFLCAATSVLAQPVNDVCGSVTPLELAMGSTIEFTGNTTDATFAGDNVPGSGLDGYGKPVVWAAFTTFACADISVSFCGSTTPFLDAYFWEVLTAQCPADQLVITSLYNNTECTDGQPTIHFPSLPAGTWYYPIWADPSGPVGDYVIQMSATACAGAAPVNDLCENAPLHGPVPEEGLTITGDNTGATDSEGLGYATVWERFSLSTCADVTVDYCGTAFSAYASGLFTNCPPTLPITPTSADTCATGASVQTFSGLAPGTYWIPVLMQADSAVGTYAIQVQATPCATSPLNNDTCDQVVPQHLGMNAVLSLSNDNTGATDTEGLGFASAWEAFTLDSCADVELAYCGTDFLLFATGIHADCSASEPIPPTSMDTCANGRLIEVFTALPAGTYWIPVLMDPDSALGAYSIQLFATPCDNGPVPANDACADAIEILNSSTDPCAAHAVDGDNSGSTASGDRPECAEGNDFSDVWFSITGGSYTQVRIVLTPGTIMEAGMEVRRSCGDSALLCTNADTLDLTIPADSTYLVRVFTDSTGVPGTFSICATSDLITAIPAPPHAEARLYPNPGNGDMTLWTAFSSGPAQLSVLDLGGRTLFSERIVLDRETPYAMPLAGSLQPGSYLLRITSAAGVTALRFIVR